MIKVAMCDDDPTLIAYYEKIFKKLEEVYRIECRYYFNANDLLANETLCKELDILYVDNYMIGLNGIQTAKELRKVNKHVQIIFLSSSPDFVFDSFEVKASQYLLKNKITVKEFIAKFDEFYRNVVESREESGRDFFVVKQQSQYYNLDLDDIIAFEIVTRKIKVYTKNRVYECYENLKEIAEKYVDKGFYLVNRSILINMDHVERIDQTEVYLTGGLSFPVAVKKVASFKKVFAQHILK